MSDRFKSGTQEKTSQNQRSATRRKSEPSITVLVITANDQLPFLSGYLRAATIPNARVPPQCIYVLFTLLRPL